MNKKLRPEDSQAVDLILDQCATPGTGAKSPCAKTAPSAGPSVQRLRRLLQLLDLHTASEPPANLVARTLAHIDSKHKAPLWHAPARTELGQGKPA